MDNKQFENSQRWAIVGGGLLGMTLAHRLAQHGEDVTLYEGAPSLGGLASTWQLQNGQDSPITWDRHYHVTLLSDVYLRGLLAEMDLDSQINWVETKTEFYTETGFYPMSSTSEFLRFPPLRMVDKFRLGATIFYASKLKNWKRLEQMPVDQWLRKLSGKRTFERIWLPLLRAKLGDNYRRTSAAFIWATIARMYAARRTGQKREMFGYVPGGYATILEQLGKILIDEGVDVRLESRVQRVHSLDGQTVVTCGGQSETFDNVVFTVPCPVISQLCEELTPNEHERLKSVEYQGIVCASLLLKKPVSQAYVTNITAPDIPFTAVIDMSALVDRQEFDGGGLVYLPKYVTAHDTAFEKSDEVLQEEFVTALEKMYPHFHRSQILDFRVSRVRHVMPLSTLGYTQRAPNMRTSQPGVYIVNSAQILNGTLNANETIRLGERAVFKLLSSQTTRRTKPAAATLAG